MMIGVSMAAAIIICIGAFIWFYVQIGPLLSDFIPEGTPEDGTQGTTSVIGGPDATSTVSRDDDEFALDEIEPEPMETSEPAGEEGDGEEDVEQTGSGSDELSSDEDGDDEDELVEDVWEPTHQIRQGPNVNFRSGPNTISQPQGALAPGTQLEFLGDEEPTGGVTWMYFEIQDGTQGWIRDIDVVEIEIPGGETGSE